MVPLDSAERRRRTDAGLVEGRGGTAVLGLLIPVAVLSVWCSPAGPPHLPYLLHGDKGSWQTATEYVAGRYQPGQAVLATFPFDPQVWYYGTRSGIPLEAFQRDAYKQAWVLASKPLAEVLRERGPKANRCTRRTASSKPT